MGYTKRDASAAGSDIAAILEDTSTTLDNLVDDLETRLTAARAGYLDNLSAGAVALASSVGTLANSGGTATLGGILGDVANSSVAARLIALAGYVDGLEAAVGTLVNSGGGTATLGGILGDVANVSIAARLAKVDKIEDTATLGLLGTSNSLAYRVHEIERHFHSYERWYELAGTPDTEVHRADAAGVGGGYFEIDAGDSSVTPTWGAWVQILGSTDTALKYDLHRLSFVAAERNLAYVVQIAFGAVAADAYDDGDYTEAVFVPASNVLDTGPVDVQSRRQAAGTKAWARCICPTQDTGYLRFRFGLHYYEG